MRAIFFSLLLVQSIILYAQKEYIIDDFSDRYYARLTTQQNDDNDREAGILTVFAKSNEKRLFDVDIEEVGYEDPEAELVSNIKQIPYGEQSLIIYEDFNFDGIEDFAIRNGYMSCYGGPSYLIYLAQNDGFTYSEEFSELGQNYCGMFSVDHDNKTIGVFSKSGCCWHWNGEYIVEAGKPKLVRSTEHNASVNGGIGEILRVVETEWDGDKMISEQVSDSFYEGPSNKLLSFLIDKNEKEVMLFPVTDTLLGYALVKDSDEIEFYYFPIEEEDDNFHYDEKSGTKTLTFSNDDAKYQIYESANSVGIRVTTKGKVYNMQGRKSSQEGSLDKVKESNLDNVTK